MGQYNSYAPTILGQEWVPIREEDTTFSPAVNAVEVGHEFTLAQSRTLQDARFYLNTPPPGASFAQTFFTSVYPSGREDLTGPIKRVVIPCNNAGITGADIGLLNASSVVEGLADPSDIDVINWTSSGINPDTIEGRIRMFFNIEGYVNQLSGKRILGVNFLYVIAGDINVWLNGNVLALGNELNIYLESNTGSHLNYGFIYGADGDDVGFSKLTQNSVLSVARLGEVNHFWTTGAPFNTSTRIPYTYDGLLQFSAAGGANRSGVMIRIDASIPNEDQSDRTIHLNYAALEVIYCEEDRLAVAGKAFGMDNFNAEYQSYVIGMNAATMRSLNGTVNPILPAGEYTATLASADVGDMNRATTSGFSGFSFGTPGGTDTGPSYPKLNALRELYEIPAHPGIQVNHPFPVDEGIVGKTFTKESTHVLPQMSLHVSGGPLPEFHVYGRQAVAQVYGSITATQEVFDTGTGGAFTYPQVRFYARRWGNTTVPLVLSGTSPSISGSSVQITPTEFDALTPVNGIIDGWKEITLRFLTPPTMGAGANPVWTWSAAGELAGNRWEVLGAIAPALSGVPGNTQQLAPGLNQLSSATYGQPTFGATVDLAWMPGYAPPVTGTTDDPTSDATILFSQDPPAISGLAVTQVLQSLVISDSGCPDTIASCVPTGLYYNSVVWLPQTSIPVTGFGAYELQRMDSVDNVWQTIMLASSPAVSGFSDYEARVGQVSSYRIRALNVYEFAGTWSATVTGTIPTPGVTNADTGILIFTTNEDSSQNLAYSSSWGGEPQEDFSWSEASDVVLQQMYGKDFVTAFRPTERGGEQFSRTLLVNALGITSVASAHGFKNLRDMAWANTSYICVRDELGNRWYATVLVPDGARKRMTPEGFLDLAAVTIIEVTDTPSPVDPS